MKASLTGVPSSIALPELSDREGRGGGRGEGEGRKDEGSRDRTSPTCRREFRVIDRHERSEVSSVASFK